MTAKASSSTFDRQDVEFRSGKDMCAAWLYKPKCPPMSSSSSSSTHPSRYPAIVLGIGLGAIKEMGLDRYAERFTDLGIVCVVFDYRHFGQSGGQPRQLLNVGLQLEDWEATIDYTSQLEVIDKVRIGIFGTSFAGGHAISVATKDERVKAAISQCPFTSGLHSSLTVGFFPLLKLGILGIRDLFSSDNDNFVRVKLAGSPGEATLMNAPDVYHYLQMVQQHLQSSFKNYVAAHFALQIGLYNPGWKRPHVHCPIFFAICGKDTVAPAGPTLSYAQRAPKATIKQYTDVGHFDIYASEPFEQAIKDYSEFLRSNL